MKKQNKKRLASIIALIVIIALPMSFLVGCTNTGTDSLENLSDAIVSIKINPEVELGVTEDGTIDSVYCVNEDAEILLADENLVGMSVDEASETFVNLATEAGYIDVDSTDNEVSIDVITEEDLEEGSENEEEGDIPDAERIRQRIKQRIDNYFKNNGIFGVVSEQTLEEYAEAASELGLPIGQVKMIMRALELNPELTLDDVKELQPNILMALCKDKGRNNKVNAGIRNEFKEDCDEIKAEYPNIPVLAEEIKTLEAQLDSFEGTEEDRAALEATLEQKRTEFETEREAMKEDIEAQREQYKAQAEAQREEMLQEKERRMQENENKREEHMREFENNRRQKMKEIENWRKGKK